MPAAGRVEVERRRGECRATVVALAGRRVWWRWPWWLVTLRRRRVGVCRVKASSAIRWADNGDASSAALPGGTLSRHPPRFSGGISG
uniref:Uncharacterized protein n=1 Tax=Setaria italica TaxID=4555 RepID=K4AHC1_SETIT